MRKLYLCFIPLLFAGFADSFAQDGPPPPMAYVWEMTPIFGHEAMAEEALKAHAEFRKEAGDTWQWDIFQSVVGENQGTFFARSGNHEWADFDSYDVPGATAHFYETVAPHLKSVKNAITQSLPNLTNFPTNMDDLNLYQVVYYDVIPRRQNDMRQALAKFAEIAREKMPETYFSFATVRAGGSGESFMGVFPHSNFADFADPEPSMEQVLLTELGEEGLNELYTQFASSIRGERNYVVMYRRDLSVIPD